MATIRSALLAVPSLAAARNRVTAFASGMASVLDLGTGLEAYRRRLLRDLLAFQPRGLAGDWAALERDASRARQALVDRR